MNKNQAVFADGKRLWLQGCDDAVNTFMAVRCVFEVSENSNNAELRIMADSNFIAYLDGVEVWRGQFSDNPESPTYSVVTLPLLTAGKHLLAISVYYCGREFSCYAQGDPGVIFALWSGNKVLAQSDKSCRVVKTPGYYSGEMPIVTPQLGFTMLFNACETVRGDWRQFDYDDSNWFVPAAFDEERLIVERPAAAIPVMEKFIPGKLIRSGSCNRWTERESIAMTMDADQVFWNTYNISGKLQRVEWDKSGWALLYDLGEEKVGFVEFEITAAAGTVVDFGHGEHLDDGNVRMAPGSNFADRYICKEGRQRFQLEFRRIGGRYLQIHIIPPEGIHTCEMHEAGIAPWTLRVPEPAVFETADEKLLQLRKLAIRTLEHCMHEHYEDCPWREQSLYAYDSRNQMLFGYYTWGNYGFASASLNLFGGVLREDGHLRLTSPSHNKRLIPIFTTIWPLAVYEQLLFSGDKSVWLQQRKNLRYVREQLLKQYDEASQLYRPDDPNYWHFYEWAPKMNYYRIEPGEVHALYNLYLANMLAALGKMEKLDGDADLSKKCFAEAQRIRKKVDELFYLPEEKCYGIRLLDGKVQNELTEHMQIMMLYSQAVPEDRVNGVLKRILAADGSLVPVTLSVMPYLMEALLLNDYGAEARKFVRKKLEENYFVMLDGKSTTLWETVKGSSDFSYRGSLCHAWSSLPVFYCGAGLLGVYPLEVGFKRFRVRIWSDGRENAAGAVPTPSGEIFIKWHRRSDGKFDLKIKYPAGLTPEVEYIADTPLNSVDMTAY